MNTQPYEYSTKNSSIEQHPSPTLRRFAYFISILFHPLLISSYTIAFLIYIHPGAFEGVDPRTANQRMLSVLLNGVFYPALSLFLAWRLKLVKSLSLDTRNDRLVGFIVTMFFYFWTSYVFRNQPDTPPAVAHFLLGTFLAVCSAWMCTIFYKVSLHAVAMGGLVAFTILFSQTDPFTSGLYLVVPFLIAGLVCSSRLIVGAHSRFEMASGFIIGLIAQAMGWLF
jgi:hypothetical protein